MPHLDANIILNAIMLVGLLVFGPRAWSTAKLKAELAAKDEVINTNEQSIKSLSERVATLEQDLQGVSVRAAAGEQRAAAAESESNAWRARYDEQSKYTAPEGFQHLDTLLSAQGDLMLKVLEVVTLLEAKTPQRPREGGQVG